MARHGIPDKIKIDNGPRFSSQEFKNFKDLYEFDHVISSPTYPQSNGKAENAKTAQRIMLKASETGSDPYLGFLHFRSTPQKDLECLQLSASLANLPTPSCLHLEDY